MWAPCLLQRELYAASEIFIFHEFGVCFTLSISSVGWVGVCSKTGGQRISMFSISQMLTSGIGFNINSISRWFFWISLFPPHTLALKWQKPLTEEEKTTVQATEVKRPFLLWTWYVNIYKGSRNSDSISDWFFGKVHHVSRCLIWIWLWITNTRAAYMAWWWWWRSPDVWDRLALSCFCKVEPSWGLFTWLPSNF